MPKERWDCLRRASSGLCEVKTWREVSDTVVDDPVRESPDPPRRLRRRNTDASPWGRLIRIGAPRQSVNSPSSSTAPVKRPRRSERPTCRADVSSGQALAESLSIRRWQLGSDPIRRDGDDWPVRDRLHYSKQRSHRRANRGCRVRTRGLSSIELNAIFMERGVKWRS
jgi:hypothetical protein